jgi:hypothetical protein
MLNNITQTNFDINLYKFEKKKQTQDNKNKEKENKKIQINFKNSFVNEKTQHKYDKIIENNNKRNIEKQETNDIVEDMSVVPESNESEMIIIECVNSSYKTVLVDNSVNRTNILQSGNIIPNNFIEGIDMGKDGILEERLIDKYDDYDYFSDKEGPITNDEVVCHDDIENDMVGKQPTDDYDANNDLMEYYTKDQSPYSGDENEENNQIEPDEQVYVGDNKDEHVNKFENRDVIDILYAKAIGGTDKPDTYINENLNHIVNVVGNDNYHAFSNNQVQYNEDDNFPEEIPEIIEEDIKSPEPSPLNNKQTGDIYDHFLEESIGTSRKDDIQLLLRQQMKNIVYDIKDRKKGNKQLIDQKKKNLFEVIRASSATTVTTSKLNRPVNKSDIVRTDQSHEISTKYYRKVSKEDTSDNNTSTAKGVDSLLKDTIPSFNKIPEIELTFGNKLPKLKVEEMLYDHEFIQEDIKEDIDKIDENDVTSIHQSVRLESLKDGYKIDLDEFIKENTKHDIIQDDDDVKYIEPAGFNEPVDVKPIFQDDRVLVFENYQDKEE